MDEPPESLASQRALYALGLGLLAFVTSASPVGILAIALPAGAAAVAMGIAEARTAPKRSKSRRLAGAGIAFTLLGLALAAAWIYASFTFASAFGGSPRLDVGRLMCTACHVVGNRGSSEIDQPSNTPKAVSSVRAGAGTSLCGEPDVIPVWPEGDISGICAGLEGPRLDGEWRRNPAGTALQFARTVLGWPSPTAAGPSPGPGGRVLVEVEQAPDQRVGILVEEVVEGTWTVRQVRALPSLARLTLIATGTQVTVEAPASQGVPSTEVKTIGYVGSQASASSTGGPVSLGVPRRPDGGRAPGSLLVLSKDSDGRVLTAESFALRAGFADIRFP